MKNDLIKFYNNDSTQNFINNINNLNRGQKKDPLSTLISFNFYKETVHTFKLYAELFKSFSEDEILKFLPETTQFEKYFPYWNNTRNSSLCFGIKLNNDLEPIYYTHIKFDPNKRIFDKFSKFKNPKMLDITYNYEEVETGISFEYYKQTCTEKRYWYFYDDENKNKICKKFDMSNEYINHIEYTEYDDNTSKIIMVYDYPQDWGGTNIGTPTNYVYEQLKKHNHELIDNCVDFFKNEFDILPKYFGSYNNSEIISIYWSLTKKWNAMNKPYLKNHIINI